LAAKQVRNSFYDFEVRFLSQRVAHCTFNTAIYVENLKLDGNILLLLKVLYGSYLVDRTCDWRRLRSFQSKRARAVTAKSQYYGPH
jgi:hypothetical protein